jgi:hypothetical protein
VAKNNRNHNRPPAQSFNRPNVAGGVDLQQVAQMREQHAAEVTAKIHALSCQLYVAAQIPLIQNDCVEGREFEARTQKTIERCTDSALAFFREVYGIQAERNVRPTPPTPVQTDAEGRIIVAE